VSNPYIISTVAKDTVSSLNYFQGSKRNWDLCLGGVCLNFTGIKDFRLPISVVGQAFRGYEIEVKTPITKDLNLVRRD
jgi:hypothetical protein